MLVLQNQGDKLQVECGGLRSQLDTLVAGGRGLEDERDALMKERDALSSERDALLGERDALLGERDALAFRLRTDVDAISSKCKEREDALLEREARSKARVVYLEGERVALQSRLDSLGAQVDTIATENSSLTSKVISFEEARVLWEGEKRAWREEREGFQKEREEWSNERARLTKTSHVQNEEIGALRADIQSAHSNSISMDSNLIDLLARSLSLPLSQQHNHAHPPLRDAPTPPIVPRILALFEKWAQRHHELTAIRLDDSAADHARAAQILRGRIERLESELSGAISSCKRLESEAAEARRDARRAADDCAADHARATQRLQGHIERLESELSIATSSGKRLESEAAEAKRDARRAADEAKSLEEEVVRLRAEAGGGWGRAGVLESGMREFESQVSRPHTLLLASIQTRSKWHPSHKSRATNSSSLLFL